MVKQIGGVMQAIAKGDFGQRVTGQLSGDLSVRMADGVAGQLPAQVNATMTSLQGVIGDLGQIMKLLAQGNFGQRLALPRR